MCALYSFSFFFSNSIYHWCDWNIQNYALWASKSSPKHVFLILIRAKNRVSSNAFGFNSTKMQNTKWIRVCSVRCCWMFCQIMLIIEFHVTLCAFEHLFMGVNFDCRTSNNPGRGTSNVLDQCGVHSCDVEAIVCSTNVFCTNSNWMWSPRRVYMPSEWSVTSSNT